MTSQYETIRAAYDEIRKSSNALIERANVQETLAPFIKDASILDLACGSGFYSYHLLKWGASKVVGVDLSPAMLEEARAAAAATAVAGSDMRSDKSIVFHLADCSVPVPYEGGPFDVVFAAWLLNYAPSGKEMVDMFRNVAINLKDGGHFITVAPPPTQDPVAFSEAELKSRPYGSGYLFCTVTGVVDDGCAVHVHADTEFGNVDFDNFHLRQEVYEASARAAGFRGELKWRVTAVPDEFIKDRKGEASVEELESYNVVPFFGILDVVK